MEHYSFLEILISISCSVVASLMAIKYVKYRDEKVKAQIEELESYEGYIEKLGKGNLKLLRTSFAILFGCLFLFFTACITLVVALLVSRFPYVQYILCVTSMSAFTSAAGLCFYQARSIIHSSNLPEAKKQLASKKAKLNAKIT
jgi:hypothetical protein